PVGSFPLQPSSSSAWGLRLDQSISLGGQEFVNFSISENDIELKRSNFLAAKESYLLNVASAYYDVLKGVKSVEIAKANVERLTKYRDAANARLKAGEVTRTVILRAEAELSGAQADLVRSENLLKFSTAVLARVAGISGEFEIREKEASESRMNSEEPESLESLKQRTLADRVELKAGDMQKRIASAQVRHAKGSFLPTVSLAGVYTKMDEDPSSSFVNKESAYGTLSINFPIFEGGLRRAEVREAEARQRQAELQFEDLKKSIDIEVESAYLDLRTQAETLKSLADQVKFATDNYNAVSKQFEYGLANSIDVMDANTLLVTSERQLAEAKYNYQLAGLKLKRATGTLLATVNTKQQAVHE
ncbi:MAG TPA: TolC family protein, partial [Thermodesulfovibrionales bacterium]|nr:TolC family protein [Thermodesulfovibrionales bacterium]